MINACLKTVMNYYQFKFSDNQISFFFNIYPYIYISKMSLIFKKYILIIIINILILDNKY